PVNDHLVGDEFACLLEQSGSRVALADPALVGNIDHAGVELERVVPLRDVDGSLLDIARAGREGDVSELDVEVSDTDLAQLLYTSGTTSRPKGAKIGRAHV